MKSALSKKQFISLLILLGLIFVLPLSLLLTKQRQEVRKKAAGTGALQLSLVPDTTTKNRGETLTYTVKIANPGSAAIQIRVAGVEFKVSPTINDFEVSQIKCGTALASQAFGDIFEGRIRLICYKTPGTPNDPLTLVAGSTLDLGSFQVEIKETATGNYTISSKEADGGRNNIPLGAEPYTDLSNIGAAATLTIAGTPTTTPGPTSTPIPTPTGATPTPGLTDCPNGAPNYSNGNITCDMGGLINEADFGTLMRKWHTDASTPVPTPNPSHASADFVLNDGLVNEAELGKMLRNWKTQ